jgi:hypothetical protein
MDSRLPGNGLEQAPDVRIDFPGHPTDQRRRAILQIRELGIGCTQRQGGYGAGVATTVTLVVNDGLVFRAPSRTTWPMASVNVVASHGIMTLAALIAARQRPGLFVAVFPVVGHGAHLSAALLQLAKP